MDSGIEPSGLDPVINSDWAVRDISALIKAAEDQDLTLKKLNEAYDILWFALLNYEDWDDDDEHPFHYACAWIARWRAKKYPNIWSVEEEVDE